MARPSCLPSCQPLPAACALELFGSRAGKLLFRPRSPGMRHLTPHTARCSVGVLMPSPHGAGYRERADSKINSTGASSLTPCCLHDSHHATGTATHTMLQSEQLTPGCRHSSSYHVADTVVHTMLSKPAHLFLPSLLSPSFFSFLPTNVRHPSIPQLYTYTHPTDLHAQSLTHALSPQLH